MTRTRIQHSFIITFILFAFFSIASAQTVSIIFENGDWPEILTKARQENKLIFLDAYSDWSSKCKWMKTDVFTKDEVANFFNTNYINVRMVMEEDKGREFKSKYSIRGFPHFLFINANDEVVHRYSGKLEEKAIIKLGKDAMIPEKQLKTFQDKYEKGERGGEFIYIYAKMLEDANIRNSKVLKDYLKKQQSNDLLLEVNWNILNYYKKLSVDSREFQFVSDNRLRFDSAFTKEKVSDFIIAKYTYAFKRLLHKDPVDMKMLSSLKKQLKKSGFEHTEKVTMSADLYLYEIQSDWDKFVKTGNKMIDLGFIEEANQLEKMASKINKSNNSPVMLYTAEQWIKKSIEIESNMYNNYTYSEILFKKNKKEEAISYAEKALELAKNSKNIDFLSRIEASLKKMKG